MKKSLLLASFAALGLSAAAQGVDPATYSAIDGYTIENRWIMNAGNGENGVAYADFLALPLANAGKATMATLLNGKVYITCSTTYIDGVDPDSGAAIQVLSNRGHIVVLDAETGKYIKTLDLTLNGDPYEDLLCANCIGHDDFGHLWITPYVSNTYNETVSPVVSKPIPLYLVDTETGALTVAGKFELDEIEGPGNGARVDYCDAIGDITGVNAPAVFMACPNEIAKTYAWRLEQGESEWGLMPDEYVVVEVLDTDPAENTAWNYSPMVSIVRDAEFSGELYYVDGHPTRPALYDRAGELIESLASHDGDEAWEAFIPALQPNGVLQFTLGNDEFLGYATKFPDDKNLGGSIALIKLDENQSIENATTMWTIPANELGIKKGEGRFSHSISVSKEYSDANGKKAIDILIYKDMNGCAIYRLAEEGFEAGVNDIELDENANLPVEYFNLNGVAVSSDNLVPGVYVTRQGTKASKVIVK